MNKKILLFGVLPVLAIGLVVAGLLTYYSQMQVDMTVTEAITTVGGVCIFSTVAGGDYKLCLIDVTNNLDEEVAVDITLKVQKHNGTDYVNLIDDDGLLVGLTEDVSYCFKNEGNMTGVTNCTTQFEIWMLQNVDWMDWLVLTQPYPGEYDTTLITNHGGNSATIFNLTTGELTMPDSLKANLKTQPVLYVDSSVALVPGEYRVIFEIVPTT